MRTTGAAIACVFLTFFGCRSAPRAGPGVASGSVDTLKADLTTFLDDESLPFHRVIRNATTIVRERCLGQSWADVDASLRRQGMTLMSENQGQSVMIRRYLVRSNARTAANLPFDCFIKLEEDRREAGAASTAHAGQVMAATAGLTARIGRPYAAVAEAQPPAPQDMIRDILLRPDVAETAATFKTLDLIGVTYDPIRNRWTERVPWGFHLRLDFSIDGTDKIAGRRLLFKVKSGLDPPQTWDGVPLPEGFTPADILGEAQFSGSTEWWHGDAATVAANKAKYLGKR